MYMMAAMADLFWPLWRTHHERLAAICCPTFLVLVDEINLPAEIL